MDNNIKNKENEIAVETIFVFPRNQFYWAYQINEGATHTESKEEIFKFLKDFTPNEKYYKIVDLLSRFQPFLILVREKEVIELSKKETDYEFLKDVINSEISNTLSTLEIKRNEKKTIQEQIDYFQEKFLK